MAFWWVNHKQTFKQEIEGGYIWSPKLMANGRRSHFYDNLKRTMPGDTIVSYANTKVSYFGRTTSFPMTASKPENFGRAGENWSDEGWLVPVDWYAISLPFRPKDHIEALNQLLPEKYSPIRRNGDGNQGSYLSEISEGFFEALRAIDGFEWDNVPLDKPALDQDAAVMLAEQKAVDEIYGSIELDDTEKISLVKSRRGQGVFRRNVEKIEPTCRITGLKLSEFLIASHIKPWRSCESAAERLDGSNGLLLAPHIDWLFDRGLISFEKSGQILVCRSFDQNAVQCFGLGQAIETGVGEFSDAQERYLSYHRDQVFGQAVQFNR